MQHRIRMTIAAGTAIVALAGVAAADESAYLPPGTVLEGSVETSTESVIFPSGLDGRLQINNCAGCIHSTLQLGARTRFLLAGESVSLRDMSQYALRHPGHALTIHFGLKDAVATRVTVLVR